jgi:Peptidase family M28/PDZ domain/PA domain
MGFGLEAGFRCIGTGTVLNSYDGTRGTIRMRARSTTRTIRPGETRAKWMVFTGLALSGALLVARGNSSRADDISTPERAVGTPFTVIEERLKGDVSFLASDARDGRAPGTKGIEAAADYVADVFKGAGLKPAPGADGYFQPFSISGRPKLGPNPSLALAGSGGSALEGTFQTDFMPLALGSGAALENVPIVFAGYGITAKDAELKLDYDDYAGLDVKGKAVLLIRREPQQMDDNSPFDGKKLTSFATFQHKASNAFQHGAVAALFVNDLAGLGTNEDKLLAFTAGGMDVNSNLPFVMLTRAFADKLMADAGEPSLAQLEKEIDRDLKPRSHELKRWTLAERIVIDRPGIETKNVVGVLEGAGPHADETVVIGGHYDHLGHGGLTSGSLAMFSSDIHNGADDNASGTTMVLEMARRLGARRDPLPRRVVFIAFSGEERGLLGSQYYVSHPLFSLKKTVMMINCDMVGRLNAKNELTMIGTGTSPGIDALVEILGKSAGLTIKKVNGMSDGFGGSDHESFYNKNIPVLFAFTGIHSDYHRPSDDSDRINYPGMSRIADYLELITLDVVRRPQRPVFAKLGERTRPERTAAPIASLGVTPDYSHEEKDGLSLSGVREGGPAAKAGLKEGDLIIKLGGLPIGTIYDYMASMEKHQPGDKVDVVVKRDGKQVTLEATLGGRPRE